MAKINPKMPNFINFNTKRMINGRPSLNNPKLWFNRNIQSDLKNEQVMLNEKDKQSEFNRKSNIGGPEKKVFQKRKRGMKSGEQRHFIARPVASFRNFKRLDPGQLKLLNERFKIKWWNNRWFNVSKLNQDLYWSIRKCLIRRNIGTALSPYFSSLSDANASKHTSIFGKIENLVFSFFGRRANTYLLLKRRWYSRMFSYRYRFQKVLDISRKYKYLRYTRSFIKKSALHSSLLHTISDLERFRTILEKRRSRFDIVLKSNGMLLKTYYARFDLNALFDRAKSFFANGFSSNLLVSYFMNNANNRLPYNIFRHPNIYLFRREEKKYNYFTQQIELVMQECILSHFHTSIPVFVIRPCINNMVIYVYKKGNLIFSLSAGMTLRTKSDSRRTNFAKFNVLHAACAKLAQLGINSIDLKLLVGSAAHMRKFYRAFFRKKGVIIRNLIFAVRNAHNGLRLKKARRI